MLTQERQYKPQDSTKLDKTPVEILLVDDRKENLLVLEAALTSPDYQLSKANSGDEALRYLLDHEPALILMDVQMPDLDGFETASIIKNSERTREIPIIFITALNMDERYIQKGYDFGAVDYLNKPFDVNILRSKVAVFADLYRKTQRLLNAERQLRKNEAKERERKLAELELRTLKREQVEQKKYRELVEGIDHGIVWSAVPESMVFSYVSPTAEKILQYPARAWFEDPLFWNNHLHPSDREVFSLAVQEAIQKRMDRSVEHRFIKANGDIAWLHTSIRHSAKSDGNSYELRGLSIDITQIKEAEWRLKKNKDHSDFLAEASFLLAESFDYTKTLKQVGSLITQQVANFCLFIVQDENSKIQSLQFPENTLEIREQELKNIFPRLYRKLSPTTLQELNIEASNQIKISGLNFQSAITVPLQIRGRQIGSILLFSANTFHEDDLLLAKDLAARIALAIDNAILYQKAQNAIKVRDEFLSIASHELKTPLTPMKLQTQALLRTLQSAAGVPSEKFSKSLQNFNRQIDRLSNLIEGLLDISRISIGKLTLDAEDFDLRSLLDDVVHRFHEQLLNAKCSIHIDGPQSLPVTLDLFRIEQVIVNLLTNAMKYSPSKPIHISLECIDGTVTLKVKDEGIGIAKEDQERIFMRFERAVSASHFGGLGLGLYISKQILEVHGGSIEVESTPGQGSTFIVQLPQRLQTQGPTVTDLSEERLNA